MIVFKPVIAGTEEFEGKTITDIQISGAKYTKEFVIIRELESTVGTAYSVQTAQQDIARLEHLGIFSEIKIVPSNTVDGVALDIIVTEIFPFFPSPAFRITDEDGILVGVAVNYVNAFGKAVSGGVNVLFGSATNAGFNFKDPWLFGNRLGYEVRFIHRDRNNEIFKFKEKANEFFVLFSSYIKHHGRAGLRFSYYSISSDTDGKTLSATNTDKVPAIGFYLGWDSRDRWSNPKQGWWNQIDVSKSGLFGGDSDFWQLNFDLRKYHRLSRHFVLNVTSLWTLTSGKVGVDIAEWQQFGVGGTNSVRGYGLGARIGKNQNINAVELRYNLFEPRNVRIWKMNNLFGLQIAGFADLGHAWSSEADFTLDNYISGYGLGLRLLIPKTGMLRFDFGWGESGKSIRFHVGGFEKAVKQRERVR
jgi:outer membrane protein insertion porin family